MQVKRFDMKKIVWMLVAAALLLSGCAKEFNQVYKSQDYRYKYEYAKECFAKGKYNRAALLLQELIVQEKGTSDAQESLYLLGLAQYMDKSYETAAEVFGRYVKSYPRGVYAEMAKFYVGESLYMCTPESRLDQSQTIRAITAFQEYLDIIPERDLKIKRSIDCLSCKTSWWRKNCTLPDCTTTLDPILAIAVLAATTTRLAS